ncbi:hypothetical protein [Acidocella sp.]|uniref:hypothetical protein n=1 Tax=Acidocella sp. TaxID=50710 RepID=UPI00260F1DF0|nr:hypothetical protein [Acidocella sp.]
MGVFESLVSAINDTAAQPGVIGRLKTWGRVAGLDEKTADIEAQFLADPSLPGLIIREGREIFGILSRRALLSTISQPYGREVFIKRPLREMAARMDTAPLMLPATTTVPAALKFSLTRADELRFEPVLVHSAEGVTLLEMHVLMIAQANMLEETLSSRDRLLEKIRGVVGGR